MATIKKIAYVLLFSAVFLVACQQQFISKNDQKTTEKKSIETVKTISNVLPYRLKTAELHSVVGFLSEVDVLLIKQDKNGEHLIRYNLLNGKEKTIYSTRDDIIQAFIHPSMKQILVQTASSKKKAKVTILSTEGKPLHHIEVQSSELSIVWNPTNVNLLAIAAFRDNFAYKSFVYESNKEQLHKFQAENPFWVWLTDDTLWMNKMNNNPLNGGTLTSINWRENKEAKLSNHQVVYVNCYKQSTLIVSMDFKHEEYKYVLQKGTKKQVWKAPAVTSFSQWFVPEIQWLDDQTLITLLPTKSGEIGEEKKSFQIVHASLNGVQQLGQMRNYEPMICSSKGSVCMTGFNYEKLFTTKEHKTKEWLSLRD